jgi:hypothetical protein
VLLQLFDSCSSSRDIPAKVSRRASLGAEGSAVDVMLIEDPDSHTGASGLMFSVAPRPPLEGLPVSEGPIPYPKDQSTVKLR